MREQCDTEFFDLPRPRVIAHRGASGDYPENTFPAFKAASEAGAPYLELDVHLTHDGEVVVCHDDTLTRTAGQDGVLREMTFEKIRRADAGYSFSSSQAGNFPFRGQGIQIPMLREVLTAFSQHRFIVELKHGGELVRATVEIVRQAQMSRRVLIASEHQEPIEQIRTFAPDLPTNMPTQETGLFMMSLALTRRITFRSATHFKFRRNIIRGSWSRLRASRRLTKRESRFTCGPLTIPWKCAPC